MSFRCPQGSVGKTGWSSEVLRIRTSRTKEWGGQHRSSLAWLFCMRQLDKFGHWGEQPGHRGPTSSHIHIRKFRAATLMKDCTDILRSQVGFAKALAGPLAHACTTIMKHAAHWCLFPLAALALLWAMFWPLPVESSFVQAGVIREHWTGFADGLDEHVPRFTENESFWHSSQIQQVKHGKMDERGTYSTRAYRILRASRITSRALSQGTVKRFWPLIKQIMLQRSGQCLRCAQNCCKNCCRLSEAKLEVLNGQAVDMFSEGTLDGHTIQVPWDELSQPCMCGTAWELRIDLSGSTLG